MAETGTYIECSTAGEAFQAFIPAPLPPIPPLVLTEADQDLMEQVSRALGRLDSVITLLPDSSVCPRKHTRAANSRARAADEAMAGQPAEAVHPGGFCQEVGMPEDIVAKEMGPGTDRRGLDCRACSCRDFRVVYTRPTWGGRIMRRRECRHCGKRLTTWERAGG